MSDFTADLPLESEVLKGESENRPTGRFVIDWIREVENRGGNIRESIYKGILVVALIVGRWGVGVIGPI